MNFQEKSRNVKRNLSQSRTKLTQNGVNLSEKVKRKIDQSNAKNEEEKL